MHKTLQLITLLIIFLFSNASFSQDFDVFFYEKTLRIDYLHSGCQNTEKLELKKLFSYPTWPYAKKTSLDFDYGMFRVEVYDSISNTLIYELQFSSLFGEYIYSEKAKTEQADFEESILIPLPKNSIRLDWYIRERNGIFKAVTSMHINPESSVIEAFSSESNYPSQAIYNSGNPKEMLDIVLIPDGYTMDEMPNFRSTADSIVSYLFATEPIGEHANAINIWTVEAPSLESGISDPNQNISKETAINCSFNTLESDRYLMCLNYYRLMDVALNTPFDAIIIVCNTEKYGGGGIYRHYATCAANNEFLAYLVTHEIGHSIFGLADEYYTSEVGVEAFYNTETEPWEPNITSLVNFSAKWEDMLDSTIPVPTPNTWDYVDVIGLFEGAGYMAKSLYRPSYDCTMKSIKFNYFCPVCKKAIKQMIESYTN
jgi:hypothetical protein